MKRGRERDVIDVNRTWTVFVGNRRHGYSIGTIRHSDSFLARQSARAAWPDIRIGFVEEFPQ